MYVNDTLLYIVNLVNVFKSCKRHLQLFDELDGQI